MTELHIDVAAVAGRLEGLNKAREAGLAACRQVIRNSSSAIRAVHLGQPDVVAARTADAAAALETAREALAPYPAIYHAGFLHDAAKEYVEARATAALVADEPVVTSQAQSSSTACSSRWTGR